VGGKSIPRGAWREAQNNTISGFHLPNQFFPRPVGGKLFRRFALSDKFLP
jgi:hypothetical protein